MHLSIGSAIKGDFVKKEETETETERKREREKEREESK